MFHILCLYFLLNSQVEYLDDNILKWIPELHQPPQLTFPGVVAPDLLEGRAKGPALTDLGDDSLEEVSIFFRYHRLVAMSLLQISEAGTFKFHVPRLFG